MGRDALDYKLGSIVITVDGRIGTLLGCFENDADWAVRDKDGVIHSYPTGTFKAYTGYLPKDWPLKVIGI